MSQIPRAEPGLVCPFHKKDVSKVCHKCPLWMQLRGVDPQTGKELDHWQCALGMLPMLTIENSQQQRQTAAAVESLRNVVDDKARLAERERAKLAMGQAVGALGFKE